MDKTIGTEYGNLSQREAFLKDNCDKVEEKGYMKPYTSEELQGHKEKLSNLSIEIDEIEDEKKASAKHFKTVLDPMYNTRRNLVSNIRKKSEYVHEICYKFIDQSSKEVGYYNAEGTLIESRGATADELQPTLFSIARKTGTNDE
jgi:predicted  nucleic acid-binding Zn-ribbon protein